MAIWNAAPASDYGRIVKLLMLTGQRRDEIAGLRLSELKQAGMIALPAERTKNSRPHDVPLSIQAQAVLDEVPERDGRAYVFGQGEGGFSGYSKAKQAMDAAAGLSEPGRCMTCAARWRPAWPISACSLTSSKRS